MHSDPPTSATSVPRDRIASRLARVYGEERAPELLIKVDALVAKWAPQLPEGEMSWSERDTFLITYADTLQKPGIAPIQVMGNFLRRRVGDRISFLHLLPFYPYTSDDGFSVIDYRQVRRDLGEWEDISDLATDYRLVFDAVINHVSQQSEYVKGHLSGDPQFKDFCVALDPETDVSQVTRPRTSPLLHEFPSHKGSQWLWTTFSQDQVDLNFANPEVLFEILDVLLFFSTQGATMLRLDAIPYLWKELGTNCVHRPETHEIIKLIRDVYDAAAPGMILLSETNVPHLENISYWGDAGDEAQQIYNFSLAPLILHALTDNTAEKLTTWAKTLETPGDRCLLLNITATHDGIGMRPTEGILSEEERSKLIDLALTNGGLVGMKSNPDGSETPYELNLTYYDAVNSPTGDLPIETEIARFLLSQAIPMVLPGIPGIYIHSLLASRNDYAGRNRTGHRRSINREQLDLAKIEKQLDNPQSRRSQVFNGLLKLLSIRQKQPAFHPNAPHDVLDLSSDVFTVLRTAKHGTQHILTVANLTDREIEVHAPEPLTENCPACINLLNENLPVNLERIALAPYEMQWIAWESA